jgi:abortive infection bacteriophage resistance protein
MTYTLKPATTTDQQIAVLKGRGLVIIDEADAKALLQRISYYRLSGYLVDYKQSDDNYVPGTKLSTISAIYEFDRRFRNLLIGMIEPLEISLRTRIGHYLAVECNPLAYRDPTYFMNPTDHASQLQVIDAEITRSREPFADHYRKYYGGTFPIWVAIETMSFGTVSKMYGNLRRTHRQKIAKPHYGLNEKLLSQWLWSFVTVRNACAHFARLYRRTPTFPPKICNDDTNVIATPQSWFAVLMAARHLSEPWSAWGHFVTHLESLCDEYRSFVHVGDLGFPTHWDRLLRRPCRWHP